MSGALIVSPFLAISDCLAGYRPRQVASWAGVVSFLLHFGIWHALQAAATNSASISLSERMEVMLMSTSSKSTSVPFAQPPVPIPAGENQNLQSAAIPLPVADPVPKVKPVAKPMGKQAAKPPAPKNVDRRLAERRIERLIPSGPSDTKKATETGGSAGGYGVASATGIGAPGDVGQGGGMGGGKGGGSGPGNAPGNGAGNGSASNAESYTEANFKANYATNPKPKYPELAKSLGWRGTVQLRVRVSAGGFSEEVSILRSSGYKLLDDAAVSAVEKWRFIPARRGNNAVACVVIVPIEFALH